MRRTFVIALAATLLVTALGISSACDPVPHGLLATHFSDANWSSTPARTTIDLAPSTRSLLDAWDGRPPEAFSATWSGSLLILNAGQYRFATDSDDGSWVYVDGQLVVDNGGGHHSAFASGTIGLDRGVHAIFIKYFQRGGLFAFKLFWAADDDALGPIPAWTLFPRRGDYRRLLASAMLRRALAGATWLWFAALATACIAAIARATETAIRRAAGPDFSAALTAVVLMSLVMNVTALWWGLPAEGSTWVGDELTPRALRFALASGFSGGWYDRYPPLHFYLLNAVCGPWLLATHFGWIDVSERVYSTTIVVLTRATSVAMSVGTIVVIALCGARAFGRRAGILAAAAMALAAPFVFYAKTANPDGPYLFWIALSLLFFLRAYDSLARRDFVGLALSAAFAVCTKDQAYAMYVAMPPLLVYRLWRAKQAAGARAAFARALIDARLLWALGAAAGAFALIYQLPFNAKGFAAHVADITGPGSQPYKMVPGTLLGHLALLKLTAALDVRTWGWPLTIASAAGLVAALSRADRRRDGILLALVVAGYYVAFIAIVRYEWDRYLLPIALVQALLAGVALDWLVERGRGAGVAAVAVVFAYTTMYSATVDALMLRDSRYAAGDWLRAHADDRVIGRVFPLVVLPNLDGFQSVDLGTIDLLRSERPEYFVLNADYAGAVDPASPLGELVEGLQRQTLGYRLAFRYRSPPPWPWLPGGHPDLVGPRLDPQSLSFLRDINPMIEIYARQ